MPCLRLHALVVPVTSCAVCAASPSPPQTGQRTKQAPQPDRNGCTRDGCPPKKGTMLFTTYTRGDLSGGGSGDTTAILSGPRTHTAPPFPRQCPPERSWTTAVLSLYLAPSSQEIAVQIALQPQTKSGPSVWTMGRAPPERHSNRMRRQGGGGGGEGVSKNALHA
jgi:hypothetical protein